MSVESKVSVQHSPLSSSTCGLTTPADRPDSFSAKSVWCVVVCCVLWCVVLQCCSSSVVL